jgi:hypothetical protein
MSKDEKKTSLSRRGLMGLGAAIAAAVPFAAQAQAPAAPAADASPAGGTAERSPVVYIQHGHDNTAWSNPAWQKLVLNAIKWAASQESKTWAHANAKRIFV